ncbi:MAG: hypothetical protein H7338_09210, partial [Candidatus Sericytochromatia bacterium]|nr:hypothetical protein [Candidatus Sericytochromatia bacterium]
TMAAPPTKAQTAMEIETTPAKASMTKTQKRDPNPISNRKSAADLGGLTLAYKALEKSLVGKARPKPIDGFTAEQRFFLGYAQAWASNSRPEYTHTLINTDPHPPAQFRVNGPLSNLAVFAKAFGAKPGDPMVRKEAILIW